MTPGVRDARHWFRLGRVGWDREVKVWLGLALVGRVEYNRIRKGMIG